ncbi:hypothetical protein ACIGNX_27470 [Actinosynnema sp. NPDC053489]|uniref:hypothetical protein n=1 Tax=Actinosynnema sp. NPDC053489 TaxID=3363916 RepID=UPI0037CAFBD6
MEAPDLPAPDDVVQNLLEQLFGKESLVVLLFVILVFLSSWWKVLRSVAAGAGQAYGRFRTVDMPRKTRVALNAVIVVVSQSLYLIVGHLVAVEMGVLLGLREGVPLPDYVNWGNVPATAHWDPFTEVYFIISVLVVILAHVVAVQKWSPWPLFAVSIPGFLSAALLIFAGLGALIGYNEGDPQYTTEVVWSYWVVLAVLVGYLILFFLAVTSPGRFRQSWKEKPRKLYVWEEWGD